MPLHTHAEHFFWCSQKMTGRCGCEWQRYALSASIAVFCGTAEYVAGYVFTSVSMQSDAIHLFGDSLQSSFSVLVALPFLHTLFSERWMRKWGAYIQALMLFMAAGIIMTEVLTHTAAPQSPTVMLVAGILMTAVASLRIWTVHGGWDFGRLLKDLISALRGRGTINITNVAELAHLTVDLGTSVAVAVGGGWILFGGDHSADKNIALFAIFPMAILSGFLTLLLERHGHHHENHDH